MVCLWLGPPWLNYWCSLTPARSGCRNSHGYSSLFVRLIYLIFFFFFFFFFAMMHWVGSQYANRLLMCFCIKISTGSQGEVSRLYHCFKPAVVNTAVVPVLLLRCIALWCTRVLQKVLSLGSNYFSATFYQTYFHYKPSKYSPFTETHFLKPFYPVAKSRKIVFFWYLLDTLINSAAKRTSRRILISRKHFLKPWK